MCKLNTSLFPYSSRACRALFAKKNKKGYWFSLEYSLIKMVSCQDFAYSVLHLTFPLRQPNCCKLSLILIFFLQELCSFLRYLGDKIGKVWWSVRWEGKGRCLPGCVLVSWINGWPNIQNHQFRKCYSSRHNLKHTYLTSLSLGNSQWIDTKNLLIRKKLLITKAKKKKEKKNHSARRD